MPVALESYLLALAVFAKQDDYRCVLIKVLENHEAKMEEVLSKGTDLEIERMRMLLQLLVSHRCGECSGVFVVNLMLKHGIPMKSFPARLEPTPSAGPSTGANPTVLKNHDPRAELSAAGPSTGSSLEQGAERELVFSCKYMEQCHHFMETLKVKG
eukprot:GHVR01159905.1.p1 GENE.GHVR01159905.1~~GHVR01159905.1.p1  ORF type:complete len:156 (+),score=7.33 GHVR01159905.1:49-516(+)